MIKRYGIIALIFAVGMLFGAVAVGTAWAGQTHMQNALSDLQGAENQLNMAQADKAGHRVSAINYVQQAIVQVRSGIAAGAK
jgi:hypothetical protein